MSSIVLNVTCATRGYVGYMRGHLHERVERHKQKSSLIHKHYKEKYLDTYNPQCTRLKNGHISKVTLYL